MSQRFGLGTFSDGGDVFPGVVVGTSVMDLRSQLGGQTTVLNLMHDWEATLERLDQIVTAGVLEPRPMGELRPLAPVWHPRQVFCAGANYHRHVRQIMLSTALQREGERSIEELRAEAESVGRELAASGGTPFVFSIPPSALSGARDDIVLWGPGEHHDWELELAVVISRRARNVPESSALDHVAGYTISNDISTRDVMQRPNLPLTDFIMTKGRPTFKPTGPFLVPREFVPDYRALTITLTVNGAVMQEESVDDIIYGVEELVSYVSTVTELWPGDLLLTGSPAGNAGHHHNRWLRPGDLIEAEITSLGTHRYSCLADPTTVEPLEAQAIG